jgi:hypothetical protein
VAIGGLLGGHRGGEAVHDGGERDQQTVSRALHLLPAACGHCLAQPGEVLSPEIVEGGVSQAAHQLR